MKKIIALLLTIMMVISLAGCGISDLLPSDDKEDTDILENDEDKIDAEDVVEDVLDKAEEFDSFSVEAVEYYLSEGVGLKLSDVEPDWEWELENKYCAYADEPSSGYGHAVIQFSRVEGEVTEDDYKAWLGKTFDATASVSDDGYNVIGYEFVGEGEDALSETTLEAATEGWMQGWAFRHDGSLMVVYVSHEYNSDKECYDSMEIDIGVGLQKSFDDTWDDLEDFFEENEEEIQDALDDYVD